MLASWRLEPKKHNHCYQYQLSSKTHTHTHTPLAHTQIVTNVSDFQKGLLTVKIIQAQVRSQLLYTAIGIAASDIDVQLLRAACCRHLCWRLMRTCTRLRLALCPLQLPLSQALASPSGILSATNPFVELVLVDCDKLR